MLTTRCRHTSLQAGKSGSDICSKDSLVNDAYSEFQNLTFGQSAAFLPTIDNVTLTDSITRLFKQRKTLNVPIIAGTVNDEGANAAARNITVLDASTNGIWNLTNAQISQAASFYPVNNSFGFDSPDNFFLTPFKSYIQTLSPFGEAGITGSERLVGRYMSQAHDQSQVWTFRFNAPGRSLRASSALSGLHTDSVRSIGVGTNYTGDQYPLSWVAHSADNSYLQNATSVMTFFEKQVALEWRAYIGSFIRTGSPNTERLPTSPAWPSYGALGDIVNSPVRLVPQFSYLSNANQSYSTSTQVEVAQKAQIEREDWWTSEAVLESIRL